MLVQFPGEGDLLGASPAEVHYSVRGVTFALQPEGPVKGLFNLIYFYFLL